MNWDHVDWEAVHRLRDGFLTGQAGRGDYWRGVAELRTYDETFAQRIGWKWRFVLADLVRLGWSPPPGTALDWGCGTGIASRLVGTQWPETITRLVLSDRSALAVQFAADRAREALPGVEIVAPTDATRSNCEPPATLIVSHVLGELSDGALQGLLAVARRARAVVWVEPGTHEISRRLIDVRRRLLARETETGDEQPFAVVAPCTHQAPCGMLADGNERHWCHHFAPAPPEIHTDGNWRKFGILAGIDLRALPLSYLVLDRRPAHCVGAGKNPPLPPGTHRVIGRPRVYNAYAHLFGCDETGVRDYRLMKRHDADAFMAVKKDRSDPLQLWQTDGTEILHAKPLR